MFLIYSKENCPYCHKVKTVLELTGSKFETYTLDDDFTKEQFYDKFGEGSTFPQVLYDGTKVGGCVDTIKFLKEQKIVR